MKNLLLILGIISLGFFSSCGGGAHDHEDCCGECGGESECCGKCGGDKAAEGNDSK
jgi:hypothetical protein